MSRLQNRHVPVALAVTAAALVLIGGVYIGTTVGLGRAVEPQLDATAAPILDETTGPSFDESAELTPQLAAGGQRIPSESGSDPTEVTPAEEVSVEDPATSRFLPFRIVEVAEGAGQEGSLSSDGNPSVGSGGSVETDVGSTEPLGASQPDGVELGETPAPTPQATTVDAAPEATATPTPPSVSSATGGVTSTPSAVPEATLTPIRTATALASAPPRRSLRQHRRRQQQLRQPPLWHHRLRHLRHPRRPRLLHRRRHRHRRLRRCRLLRSWRSKAGRVR